MAMIEFPRDDSSPLGRWWWSVDRWLIGGFLLLIIIGALVTFAATPLVAQKIGLERFYFTKRHFAYIIPSLLVMLFVSMLDIRRARQLCFLVFGISLIMVGITLFHGTNIKGAKRWLSLYGISVQPSEFLKPAFAVVAAWFFAKSSHDGERYGNYISILLMLLVVALLILQPDIGMTVVLTTTWCGQFFLNGLPVVMVICGVSLAVLFFILAYMYIPHVTVRVDKFLDPTVGDNYQISKSLEAFANGGAFGVGPGEGIIKKHLPDAHADFVFSVVGEEFGIFVCIALICAFLFILIRGAYLTMREEDTFPFLALSGLLMQFGLQTLINMASSLSMIPTKGMTLLFISYGGSSMMAASFCAGLILCFSRYRLPYEGYVK